MLIFVGAEGVPVGCRTTGRCSAPGVQHVVPEPCRVDCSVSFGVVAPALALRCWENLLAEVRPGEMIVTRRAVVLAIRPALSPVLQAPAFGRVFGPALWTRVPLVQEAHQPGGLLDPAASHARRTYLRSPSPPTTPAVRFGGVMAVTWSTHQPP